MPEEIVTLKHPFEFEGQTIESVPWNRLKGRHIIAAEREMTARAVMTPGDAERTFYIVAQAIGHPPELLEMMDIADYLKLAGKAADFLSA